MFELKSQIIYLCGAELVELIQVGKTKNCFNCVIWDSVLRRSATAYNNFIWSYIDSGGIRTQNSSCDKRQHFFCASHIVSK